MQSFLRDFLLPVVLRPVYSGDGLLTGEEGGGTSTDVADFAGENDGTGEGVGGTASVKMISSCASAMDRDKVSPECQVLRQTIFKELAIAVLIYAISILCLKLF